jgi:hypothetical protein
MRIPSGSPVLVILILALVVSNASAQEPAPLPAGTGEVRVEFSAWGQGSIYDGETRVGSIGLVRSDLEQAVRGSENAVRHARRFRTERMAGQALIAAGTVISGAILAGYARHNRLEMGDGSAAVMFAGVAAVGVGSHRLVLSRRALGHALEEHNGRHGGLAVSAMVDPR